jgi:aldose sugar dehydrogenase
MRTLAFACLVLAASACSAQTPSTHASQHGRLSLDTVAEGLAHPWGLAFLPDGRMLVTERPGTLRIVGTDGSLSDPVAGVPAVRAAGQGGLLDVALSPDFASDGLVYLTYSEPGEGEESGTALARGKLAGNALTDVEVLFRQTPKLPTVHHFGSRIVFDGKGHVFVTLGDRGVRPMAQQTDGHQGAVVRIALDGSVPADNPFLGKDGVLPEIWSYGHRNIQGAARHPATGALWTHEHGPRGGDEINIAEAGKNYGWPLVTLGINYSGEPIPEAIAKTLPGMEDPIHQWTPSIGPSGMAFYTADRFPAWKGNLFVGALAHQVVIRLELDGNSVAKQERLLEGLGQRIRDVRQGPDGYLYLLTDAPQGKLYRLGLMEE